MPIASLTGVSLNYEIIEPAAALGGPAIVLSPGGRNPLEEVRVLGKAMAQAGYRVLLHDRRNCGASDVGFDAGRSEYEMWAEDLDKLLDQLRMKPAIIGGSSSGARLALTYALNHGADVRALLLMRITGGRFAVDRLIEKYYDSYTRAASSGGMAAVCETEHFAEMIRRRPENRALLMAQNVQQFITCMNAWRRHFLEGIDLPLIGTTKADLGSLAMPVCIIPGNDLTHPLSRGALVAPMIKACEVHYVTELERDIDVTPAEEWTRHYPQMAQIFGDFLRRKLAAP